MTDETNKNNMLSSKVSKTFIKLESKLGWYNSKVKLIIFTTKRPQPKNIHITVKTALFI